MAARDAPARRSVAVMVCEVGAVRAVKGEIKAGKGGKGGKAGEGGKDLERADENQATDYCA